jgi:hypothetical protein
MKALRFCWYRIGSAICVANFDVAQNSDITAVDFADAPRGRGCLRIRF